jgi:hypothetical protein
MGANDIPTDPEATADGLWIALQWIIFGLILYGGILLTNDWLKDRSWWPYASSDADCKFLAGAIVLALGVTRLFW